MKSGLDDVVAAETVLSDVDGKNGRLIVRGVSLDDLVLTQDTFGEFLTLPAYQVLEP